MTNGRKKSVEDSIFSPSMLFLSLLTSGRQPTAFLTLRSFPVPLLLMLYAWRAQNLRVGESLKTGSVGLSFSPLGRKETVDLLREGHEGEGWVVVGYGKLRPEEQALWKSTVS